MEWVTLKVRVELMNVAALEPRFLDLRVLPREGEWLESGSYGTCEVVSVTDTPGAVDQRAVLVLRSVAK